MRFGVRCTLGGGSNQHCQSLGIRCFNEAVPRLHLTGSLVDEDTSNGVQNPNGEGVTLRRGNVDLAQRELVVTTRKTGRRQVLPLAVPLLRHLESIPASENATEPLFPKACATRGRSQCGSMLSSQFHGILVVAGLAQARPHTNTGKGRDTRREAGGLSFHCLRHTVTSLLKNAGVSDAVARDIIGHNSPAVSASYTHIDMDAKRRAVDKLPDILK